MDYQYIRLHMVSHKFLRIYLYLYIQDIYLVRCKTYTMKNKEGIYYLTGNNLQNKKNKKTITP